MPKWIRVRDTSTGHQYDVEESALRHGLEPLNDPERWPDLDGPGALPRPAKPYVAKDGQPPSGTQTDPSGQSTPDGEHTDTTAPGRAAGNTQGAES